jgi:hypothetical protein
VILGALVPQLPGIGDIGAARTRRSPGGPILAGTGANITDQQTVRWVMKREKLKSGWLPKKPKKGKR